MNIVSKYLLYRKLIKGTPEDVNRIDAPSFIELLWFNDNMIIRCYHKIHMGKLVYFAKVSANNQKPILFDNILAQKLYEHAARCL